MKKKNASVQPVQTQAQLNVKSQESMKPVQSAGRTLKVAMTLALVAVMRR